MKKIFFVYRTPRSQNFKNVKKNIEPDHILYGFNYLNKMGFKVQFSDVAYSKFNIFHLLLLPVEKLIISIVSIGFKLDQAILLLPKLMKSDVVITTTDSCGLPILLFKRLKILRTPILYISIGLINELYDKKDKLIFKIYRDLLNQADKIICYSKIERNLFLKLIPGLKNRVKIIKFGVDKEFFNCQNRSKNIIFSVGRDKSRDFQLLSKVAELFPKERFVVVSSKDNIKGISLPKNVETFYDLSYLEVKKFYCKSKIVLIPLREINRASGQISFLESLASNNKVVIGLIKGIEDSYHNLLNSPNVFTYKVGVVESMEEAMKKALIFKQFIDNSNIPSSKEYADALDKNIRNL